MEKQQTLLALTMDMMRYFSHDPKRISHFLKVHSFARTIALGEKLDEETQFILECTALVHDIGIKNAEKKYSSCGGKLQEQEGEPVARAMLEKLGFSQCDTDRIAFLVAHHHTYTNVVGQDYQILLEADFLVNLFEDDLSKKAIESGKQNIFKTKTGLAICDYMTKN